MMAAGWAVIDALENKVNGSIHLKKVRGDIAELLDIFGHTLKSIWSMPASALSSIGSWERIDALQQALPEENGQTSTHGLGVAQAVALAKNLDLLPAKLIIYAIAGGQFRDERWLNACCRTSCR